ncbi:MAG TPA: GTPase HflX [Gemmatimonadaceae bacterium]
MSRELIDLTAPSERALLIGAPRKGRNAKHRTAEHLEELARLADTAGAEVVGEVVQQIDRPNPATYLGKGKVEELTQTIADKDATLLLFDDELSPSQGKNIEDITGLRVMDRAELILDIFATRARSSEAKMQVELAQLQYMLPRLTRMWAHLEKFRGGIGVRGPGETQLETDRRLINHRIKVLGARLTEVQKSREVQRGSRRGEFQASLVGYTNAGKSSILRSLAADDSIFVENRLFATLDPLTREVELADGEDVLLTDTVGFVRKLPHQLVASFRATLEEVLEADVLLHVIDISDPLWEDHRAVVVDVLSELGANHKPVINVFNKSDLLPPEELEAVCERVTNLIPDAVFASAETDGGLDSLRRALLRRLRAERRVVELRVPMSDGRLLAELHRTGDVIGQRTDGDEMIVSVRLSSEALGRLGARAVAV